MDVDSLKNLLEGFDLAAFLPKLDTLLGWVETIMRLCVMIGPLLLLGFGLLYLVAPPKEANYSLGYRFWWSMASLDAWQFTHRLVGCIWMPLGLILTIVMAIICNGFRGMEAMDMVWSAVKCLGWELGLALLSCLVVDVVVVIVFDRKGYRRKDYE
jgi:hypothetical protein